jgi:hypothetical protein
LHVADADFRGFFGVLERLALGHGTVSLHQLFLWWVVLSECFEQRSLIIPIGRQAMLLGPIGGESGWLFALEYIPNDVWREESQINHLLHATLGCLFEPPPVCRRLITSSHATISNALNCA